MRAGTGGRAVAVFAALGVVCLQALATGFVPPAVAQVAAGGGLVAPCEELGTPYNRWARLPMPRGRTLAHVAAFAQDPCTFIGATSDAALYRATDARTWRPLGELEGLDEVRGVVSEEMPVGTAFVFGAPPGLGLPADGAEVRPSGLYATRDFGATFQPVEDLRGFSVTAVVAAPSDPQVMYASASPLREVPVPLVLKSDDFGRTWIPLPGSLPVRATRLAVDAADPGTVWANSSVDGVTPSAGIWRSDDGGLTFAQVRTDTVVDFDTAPIAGGGSRVDMATAAGIVRTRDDGATFRSVGTDPVAAITHEKFAPDALMAVVSSAGVRSTTAGRTFKPTPGLPSIEGCTVTDLTRNEEFPSHFVLSLADCDAAGHYRYRSDGRDLLNVDDIGGDALPSPVPPVGRLDRSEMRILREIPLPVSDVTKSSGSLAFDGEMLYYTNNETSNQIHVSTTTGELVKTLTMAPEHDIRTLTYDPKIERLWAMVNETAQFAFPRIGSMYQIDPVTGTMKKIFRSPLDPETTLSMDSTMGIFRSYEHHGYGVFEISTEGVILDRCEVPGFPVDANLSVNPDRGHPESPAPGFASGLAVGGGKMYLQSEDDRTVFHVSQDCEILAVLEHRRFAESRGGPSGLENDQMACDTVTFGQPAIWIRDAAPNTAVAYAVPNGYCPLATKMTLDPPELTAQPGEAVRACAVLLEDGPSGTFTPVGGAEVTFYSEDLPAGTGITDGTGRACTSLTAPTGGATDVPIEAAFFGTISHRPSSATGSLTTTIMAVPPDRPPVPPVPAPPVPPQVVLLFPPPPVPHVPLGTSQAPSPQQQPQPQAQQQPQAQAQAGFATQKQQQTQLAFAFGEGDLAAERGVRP